MSDKEKEILDKPVDALIAELDDLVKLPKMDEIKKEREWDVIRLNRRDVNIVRFIPPFSIIYSKYKIDTGYFNWKKPDRESFDKDGFYLKDTSKLGLPLTSGLEMMTYIITHRNNSQTLNGTIQVKWSRIIKNIYSWNLGTSQTILYLEKLSLYAKKFGRRYDKNWKYFVDPTYWGHRYRDVNWFQSTKREAINDWFITPATVESSSYYDEFLVKYKCAIKLYFSKFAIDKVKKKRSIDEFLLDPASWATSGSTPGRNRPHNLYSFIPRKDLKNTKWLLGFNTLADLRKEMLSESSELLNVNDKEEAGKVRIFISAGMTSFLKQAYIGEVLFQGLGGNQEQTVFWSVEQRFERWKFILEKMGGHLNLPADLSAFDQKAVSRQMIIILFNGILDVLVDLVADAEYVQVMKLLILQYENKPFTIDEGEKIVMEKGMPSGWYWTAFMDSVISWCYYKILITDSVYVMTQGDDILAQLHRRENFVRFWWLVKRYNVEINAKKFYVDNERAEYLRISFEKDGMFGYPARAIGSLLWRKPWNEDIKTLREKLEASLSSWKRLLNRSGIGVVVDWMLLDMRGIMNNKANVSQLIYTDRFNGGLGIGDDRELIFEIETDYKLINTEIGNFNFSNSAYALAIAPVNFLKDKVLIRLVESEQVIVKRANTIGLKNIKLDFSISGSLRLYKNEYKNKTVFESQLAEFRNLRNYDKYIEYKFTKNTVILLNELKDYLSKRIWLDLVFGQKLFKPNTSLKFSDTLLGTVNGYCEDVLISNILQKKVRNYNQLNLANYLLTNALDIVTARYNRENYRFCD